MAALVPAPPVKDGQPVVIPPPRKHWYELDWLVPYRDVVLVLGFASFVTGVFLLPRFGVQAGLMVLGVGLVYAAWNVLLSR